MTASVLDHAYETRTVSPLVVFDPVDRFARDRAVSGRHPRPVGRIAYRLIAIVVGGARQDLGRPLDLVVTRNAAGYDCWFGELREPGGSRRNLTPFPVPFVVVVDAEGHQDLELQLNALPAGPTEVALEPGYAYPFPAGSARPGSVGPTLLRGTLRSADGGGVEGVTVRVDPPPPGQPVPPPRYVTDETGQWVLPFDDAVSTVSDATVRLSRPGQPDVLVHEVPIVRGDTSSLRQAAVTGRAVHPDGRGVPRVVVTVSGEPGSATTTAEGSWTFWFQIDRFLPSLGASPVAGAATPPQGPPQNWSVQVQPRTTTRVPDIAFP